MSASLGNGPNTDDPEFRFVPRSKATNTAGGDNSGVQAGTVLGDITLNGAMSAEPDLCVRRAAEEELREVTGQFVAPGKYDEAGRVLRAYRIVVLCGRGTGRAHAAKRLLVDAGLSEIIEVNRDRALRSVRVEELDEGIGYVWHLDEVRDTEIEDGGFEQLAGVIRAAGCWLVIVLDHHVQSCSAAQAKTITLTAPDALEVAASAIRYQCPDDSEGPIGEVKTSLADALLPVDPPEKAVRAAELAIRVHNEELTAAEASAELLEDVGPAVDRWFAGWSVREYALALAVAVLEGEPFDVVASNAWELDEAVRTAELPEDKPLRPRRVFDKSRENLLRDIRATVVAREHPRHPGLVEETVRFERQGWARAVLCHAWREYPALHGVLGTWLCSRAFPGEAARRAITTITCDVPAHDPLRLVNELAGGRRWADRLLAAATVVQLADEERLRPLVEQTLEEWTGSDHAYRQATAALILSSSFGQQNVRSSLVRLARIARSPRQVPQNTVVAGVLGMLSDQVEPELVLREVLGWSAPQHQRTGLRRVGLAVGLWVAGLCSGVDFDVRGLAQSCPDEIGTLVRRVMADPEYGELAVDHLLGLALHARWDDEKAADLVRITSLVVPDLRWWRRHRRVAALRACHPHRRSAISRVFRAARRAERDLRTASR
ncbi:hypothetical protein [Saccharopolyspora cebuensis]|uniref:Uncharacterized protein n=1 Tax=Saccharopolyspora cebuensis TaxID=418759 RepID=A0ABV4CTY4_9PSEU